MADVHVSPNATTLGRDVDMTSDPDVQVLRVAAEKAQEAAVKVHETATRYQTQTASLCGSISVTSSCPHSNPKDHGKVSSSQVEIQHSKQMVVAEGSEPAKERDNNASDGRSREDTSYPSATTVPTRRSSPGDSALGESLSDTEELVRQPSVNTQPSIVDTTTPIVATTSTIDSEVICQQQSFGPLLPHGVNVGKPKTANQKPKRPFQSEPPGLAESAVNKAAFQPSFRRSLSISAQNLRRSKNDKIQSGSNVRHLSQESSSQRVRSFSRSEDLAFNRVFKAVVFTNVNATADRYKNYISKDELVHIGKLVANEVVDEDFQYWVRENSYKLNNEQQKEIKEFITTSFKRRISQVATIDLISTVHDDHAGGSFKGKSVTKVTSKGLSLDPFDQSSSRTSTQLHASNDLSLLGPGQISESTPTSAQISIEDDLSLLGPGQMPQLIDPVTGLKKLTAKARPFSGTNSHDQCPGIFQDITLASTYSHLLSSNARNFDSTSLRHKEKPKGSRSARSHAQGKELAGEKSRTLKRSARAISRLEIAGDLEHDTMGSVLSLDGNSDAYQSLLSRDELSMRQQRSYGQRFRSTKGGLKKNDKKPNGKKPSLQTAAHTNGDTSPYFVYDTSSPEDGDEVLATWLSLKSKSISSSPTVKKMDGSSEISFNSLDTSIGIAIENSSKTTSLATDSADVAQGSSSTSFQKNKAKELISNYDAIFDDDDMACYSNDQLRLTSNVSESLSKAKSTEATKESAPHITSKFKTLRPTVSRSGRLLSRGNMPSSEEQPASSHVQPDALEAVISRGDFSTTVDPTLEQTIAALANNHSSLYRPYISHDHNLVHSSDSHNTLKHVDFDDEECEDLLHAIYDLRNRDYKADANVPVRARLQKMIQGYSNDQISELINRIDANPNGVLRNRKPMGIKAFFADLENGLVTDRPGFVRVEMEVIDPAHNPQRSVASLLRHRELGSDSKGRRFRNIQSELRLKSSQNILPWRSWKRASGDVVTCAWAPNSLTYAVGAAAPSNNEDLQYNRPHNLLLGDLSSNVLQELPDHRVERPLPDMIPNGPNSSHDMYNNLDPMIYMTVSSLQFSRDGSQLITSSLDKTAKIWDIPSSGTATCLHTIHHDAVVTGLDVSQHFNGLFATASKTVENSIRVYRSESLDADGLMLTSVKFSSSRAQKRPEWEVYPECLRWGKTPKTSHMLLAGFQQWGGIMPDSVGREGQICLWDVRKEENLGVSPSRAGVLTAAWHPTYDMFAVGSVTVSGSVLSHPQTTRSIIRTWDTRYLKRVAVEYECPALDMQDVTFNPLNPNILTAGCTDSATYVWDFRSPDQVLLKLQHGQPLMEWDQRRNQEEVDAGVMMNLWGLEGSHLYTGSSDGIIKCWDTSRAPEDALVRNVADLGAGVQSGAFSPDFSHLLVGDSDGAIHLLTSAPVDRWFNYADSDDDVPAVEPIHLIEAEDPNRPNGNEGILAANKLLQTGQLLLYPDYGVGQGPSYSGPYAKYARKKGTDPAVTDLLPHFDAMQPFSSYGDRRPEIARRIEGVIQGRKQLIAQTQQSEKSPLTTKIIKHEGGAKKQKFLARSERPRKKRGRSSDAGSSISPKRVKTEIIDLTGYFTDGASPSPPRTLHSRSQSRDNPIQLSSDSDLVEDDAISDKESLQENPPLLRANEDVSKRLERLSVQL